MLIIHIPPNLLSWVFLVAINIKEEINSAVSQPNNKEMFFDRKQKKISKLNGSKKVIC